ncbi:MAG: right-handed parallel beta-helix repeat-containing protein, partial [Promethearchaeota archaeon]
MNKKVKVYAFLLLVALFGSQIPILASGTDKTQKTPNKVSISENSSQEQYQDSSNQPQKDTNPQPSAVNAPFVLHNESWDKNYGDANHDIAFAVKECVNGDLLIAGETEIDGTGYYDMLLIRTDAEGNQLWKKSYGWPSVHEAAFDVIECENGDIVIAGYRNMAGWGQQTWIVRTNSSGDIQYNSFPGGYDDDYVRAIVECKNGSLAAVGSTLSFGADSYDIYLILMYPNCTLLDQRAYFTSGVQKGYGLVQCDDEGFAISGHSGGWPMFMRTDRNLNQIDYDLYSFDGRGGIHYSIVKCREGGFAMTGYVDQSGTPFDYAMTLFRIDDDGNELWKKIYGGVARDEGSALVELQEGGFAMVGVQHSWWVPPHGGAQFWLVRTDEYGNRLWDQVYQNHGSTWAFALTQCANSDLVLAGWTNGDWGTGFGDYDAYVVRVPLKVYRAPITINSWTELESLNEGFLGDGSASNPFAIGDWIINTPSINHSLALVDITNASIMIEYCELTGASNGAGLLLSNINHATISNNDCHGNRYGIICSYTDDITIENTVCSENSQTGIYLIWATNSELKHCNSVENQNGLKFTYDSTGNVVQNCSFINNHEFGFYVDSA